jgi:hypothetical protein
VLRYRAYPFNKQLRTVLIYSETLICSSRAHRSSSVVPQQILKRGPRIYRSLSGPPTKTLGLWHYCGLWIVLWHWKVWPPSYRPFNCPRACSLVVTLTLKREESELGNISQGVKEEERTETCTGHEGKIGEHLTGGQGGGPYGNVYWTRGQDWGTSHRGSRRRTVRKRVLDTRASPSMALFELCKL